MRASLRENPDAGPRAVGDASGISYFATKHAELRDWTARLRDVARSLPQLEAPERVAAVADLVAFLEDRVEPHTRIDEAVLYPTAESRSGSPLASASMAYDHLAIRYWIARLADADENDVDLLQELLYGLDALIRVHLWKEDELFVKPLASSTWPASGA
jgi:hemerythrin-like domain-containing protein